MKRTVGTLVLFVLLILTIAAITQLDTKNTSAFNSRPASQTIR